MCCIYLCFLIGQSCSNQYHKLDSYRTFDPHNLRNSLVPDNKLLMHIQVHIFSSKIIRILMASALPALRNKFKEISILLNNTRIGQDIQDLLCIIILLLKLLDETFFPPTYDLLKSIHIFIFSRISPAITRAKYLVNHVIKTMYKSCMNGFKKTICLLIRHSSIYCT